jgi:SAM-dependent methyltransferase
MTANSSSSLAGDPRAVADCLEQGAEGIWFAAGSEPVSYLEEGNAMCFELEEKSFWFAHRGKCVSALIHRFPPSGTIYDIGGGNGHVARVLLDAGIDTTLVEPGETGARNAVRRGIGTVICATLNSAGFRSGVMPAAGLFDVIEHVPDDDSFLREVWRCLVPGGRLYVTVPAHPWLWSHDDVAAGHYRRYTLGSLSRTMKAAGFAPLYATYFFSLLPLPLMAMRSVPSLFGRRALPPQSYGRLHQPRARGLMDAVWAAELRRIESGKQILFGSSCLLAAEKRDPLR